MSKTDTDFTEPAQCKGCFGSPPRTSPRDRSSKQVVFQTPWEEGVSEGLQHLEHIYLSIPTQAPAKKLYYDVLGFAPDARRLHNLQKGSGTIWANIGVSLSFEHYYCRHFS